jgi:hypothetical protein
MARTRTPPNFLSEVADLLVSSPSREQLLKFRPSKSVQRLAEKLLQKQNDGDISWEEQQLLDEFAHFERLFRVLKARLRGRRRRAS